MRVNFRRLFQSEWVLPVFFFLQQWFSTFRILHLTNLYIKEPARTQLYHCDIPYNDVMVVSGQEAKQYPLQIVWLVRKRGICYPRAPKLLDYSCLCSFSLLISLVSWEKMPVKFKRPRAAGACVPILCQSTWLAIRRNAGSASPRAQELLT